MTVVRRWVWSRNLVSEKTLAHWGAVAPNKNLHNLSNVKDFRYPGIMQLRTCSASLSLQIIPVICTQSKLSCTAYVSLLNVH
jgi:hypothetical protein